MYLYVCPLCSVCLNISDSSIHISGMGANVANISDTSQKITCLERGMPCYVECMLKNDTWSNGTHVCAEAKVEENDGKRHYNFGDRK